MTGTREERLRDLLDLLEAAVRARVDGASRAAEIRAAIHELLDGGGAGDG